MTELILNFRGVSYLNEYFYFNLCPLELAAKYNFHEGISYFLSLNHQNSWALIESVTKSAIKFHSLESIQVLIEAVAGSDPLDLIYPKQAISLFLSTSIAYRNIEALKFILSKLSVRNIDELGLKFDGNLHPTLLFCNLFHYAAHYEFEIGFDILIEHFGIEALEQTDGMGRTPFLLTVINRKLYFALKIAKLNPNSVQIPDMNGNTALHLMISYGYPIYFIKSIASLNLINWATRNYSFLTPLEILESIKSKKLSKYYDEIYLFILEFISK